MLQCCIIDIDECIDANPCGVNTDCLNTPGSFICRCSSGFIGDGLTCAGNNINHDPLMK